MSTFCIGGTVIRTSYGKGGGQGSYYSVPGLSGIASDSGAILVTGMSPSSKESVAMMLALDSTKHIVTFGSDFESVEISGTGILGNRTNQREDIEGKLEAWYAANRVSKLEGPIFASKGGKAYSLFVLGLNMGKPDAMNIVPFSISCVKATAAPSK